MGLKQKKSWKRHGQQRVECTFQNALLSWHVPRSKIQFRVQYEFLFWEPLTSFGDNFEAEMACLWPYLFRHSCHSSSPKASLRTLLERQGYIRKTGVQLLNYIREIKSKRSLRWLLVPAFLSLTNLQGQRIIQHN